MSLSACDGDDNGSDGAVGATGSIGATGEAGATGPQGVAGINCWDLDGDRVDDSDEDINKDGLWDASDCAIAASSAQNKTVELNHQHMCEALAGANIYPVGCPSAIHIVPTGTLTDITTPTFFDDGTGNRLQSCALSPDNGLLSISLRDFVNSDGDTVKQGWFELEGGYIVSEGVITRNAGIIDNQCFKDCEADSNCIASVAVYKTSESFSCRLFYHSDTAGKYERVCGLDVPGFTAEEQCKLTLGGNTRWAARCP
ncbi:MAG: collagen-like protein [Thalassotalea sp.]|nr:collagen-like protein [Thalassotalea sp.]